MTVITLAPSIRKYLPDDFVGPPDPWAMLKVDSMMRLLDSEPTPYLWKIGGYYVWWDWDDGWTIDGSQPWDATFIRSLICAHDGRYQRMD